MSEIVNRTKKYMDDYFDKKEKEAPHKGLRNRGAVDRFENLAKKRKEELDKDPHTIADREIYRRHHGLKEGAAGSRLSKHSVVCPSCEGKKKTVSCERCEGTGRLQGKVKLPLNKQNTGAQSRIAWIKGIKEDVPTNAMGASSSTPGTGAIDTYDPVLDLGGGKVKNKMRKKLFDILRRKLAKNV